MKKAIILFWLPVCCFAQATIPLAKKHIQEEKFAQAESLLLTYLVDNTNNLEAIELLGDTYGFQKKWDEAIAQFKKLKIIKPKNANYHYKYGGVLGLKALQVNKLKALSVLDDIKEAFLTAAMLDAKHVDVRWALVELYMQLPGILGGSTNKSLLYAEELQNLSLVDGYLAKGYIYEYDKQPAAAEKYYKKAIQVGGSVNCYNQLANFYENSNQPEQAIVTLNNAYKKHQRNAMHYQIGKIAAKYGIQLQKGIDCLHTYIKNYKPQDGVPIAWAQYRLAQIYKLLNNQSEALTYINKAITALPNIKVFKEEKANILKL